MELDPDINTYNLLILSLKNSSIETIMKFWNQFIHIFEPNLDSFYSILVVMNRSEDYSYLKSITEHMFSKDIVSYLLIILIHFKLIHFFFRFLTVEYFDFF